jgi:hypothetical protein
VAKKQLTKLQKSLQQQIKDAEKLQADVLKQQKEAQALSKKRADELAAARASQQAAQLTLRQMEFERQRAAEQAENARLQGLLAKSEAEKKAAEEAAAAAKAQFDAANAALAAGRNENANIAAGNINVSGNVNLNERTQADIAAENYAKLQAEKERDIQRQSIIDVLTDRFNRYNLQSLIPTIKKLAQEGATESTITLALQESEAYQRRFKANQDRIKKNLAVLTPAEYLNLEDGYRQILRSYGLNQFDTDDYVQQFIANDVSAAELSNRVVTAVQRVRNADPAIAATLKQYYGIGDTDLVAYVLDPNQQFPKIQQQVAAAEIGAAAGLQGIQPGVATAEQLARQGITQAEAQRGYATIANILPSAQKLSQIYGTTLEGYGLAEAEQEVFNSLASAQRKRQRLAEREAASFGGASGTGRSSLSAQTGGAF